MSKKLEQLEFILKKILGFINMQEKLEKVGIFIVPSMNHSLLHKQWSMYHRTSVQRHDAKKILCGHFYFVRLARFDATHIFLKVMR